MNEDLKELLILSGKIIKEHCKNTNCHSCGFLTLVFNKEYNTNFEECLFTSTSVDNTYPKDWIV